MTTTDSKESRLVYLYGEVLSGFAARLTFEEVKEMEKKEGFLQAYLDQRIPLLITHTPDFLGLTTGIWKSSNHEDNVIIDVIDPGFTPDHPSYKSAIEKDKHRNGSGSTHAPVDVDLGCVG